MTNCSQCKNPIRVPAPLLQRYAVVTPGKDTIYICQQCRAKPASQEPPPPDNPAECELLKKIDFYSKKADFAARQYICIGKNVSGGLALKRRLRIMKMLSLLHGFGNCILQYLGNGPRHSLSVEFIKRMNWDLNESIGDGQALNEDKFEHYSKNPRELCAYMGEGERLFSKLAAPVLFNQREILEKFVELLTDHDKGYHRVLGDLIQLDSHIAKTLADKISDTIATKKLLADV